jgi:glutamate racemase
MKNGSKLGIIDWGIGGISIYKLVRERLGDVPVVYFSDTGAAPYGKMTREELVARLDNVIDHLGSRGITHLVIGCNAASTAIPYLKNSPIKIKGVIESAVGLAARIKPERLGVIGGRRTVVSGVYRKAFRARGIEVSQRIAQPLSGLIESGDISSDRLKEEARRILGPIRNSSHILLACTHYPAITSVLKDLVSPGTVFIDPAEELVREVKKWKLPAGAEPIFLTSGDVKAMRIAAKAAFGVEIDDAKKIVIQ